MTRAVLVRLPAATTVTVPDPLPVPIAVAVPLGQILYVFEVVLYQIQLDKQGEGSVTNLRTFSEGLPPVPCANKGRLNRASTAR